MEGLGFNHPRHFWLWLWLICLLRSTLPLPTTFSAAFYDLFCSTRHFWLCLCCLWLIQTQKAVEWNKRRSRAVSSDREDTIEVTEEAPVAPQSKRTEISSHPKEHIVATAGRWENEILARHVRRTVLGNEKVETCFNRFAHHLS